MEKKNPDIIRIAVTGPECTGKSYLCEALAKHFDSPWVPEFARDYLAGLGRKYEFGDLVKIAKGQQELEDRITEEARSSFVFSDTEQINLKIWSEFWYQKSDPWISRQIHSASYDCYFLMSPDIPWEPDPLRENPNERQELFNWFKRELTAFQKPYIIISGDFEQRLRSAIAVCSGLVSKK